VALLLAVVNAKRNPHGDLSEENKHQKDVDDNIGTNNNKGLVQHSNSAVLKTTIKKTAPITIHPLEGKNICDGGYNVTIENQRRPIAWRYWQTFCLLEISKAALARKCYWVSSQ
jgi:hypothetical protein